MKYKIFVISLLENNTKRRGNVEKQLTGLVDFEFVDAVVGNLIVKENDTRISKEAYWLRPGQLGCALCHVICYQKIIEQELDFGIILEDDFFLKNPNVFDLTNDIFSTISNTSAVISFFSATFSSEELTFKKYNIPFFRLTKGRPIMTLGYLINKKACQKFLDKAFPIITAADDWKMFIDLEIVDNFFIQYPFPIVPGNFESQIGYSPQGRKQKILHFLKTKIGISLNFIDKRKYIIFEND